MHEADTFETPHPTDFTREQAYRLPSSKPQTALTPYSPVSTTTTQTLKENCRSDGESTGSDEHKRHLSSETLSSITLASSSRSNKGVLQQSCASKRMIHSTPDASPSAVTDALPVSHPHSIVHGVEILKRLSLKEKMKSRSTSAKSKTGRMGQTATHIATSAAQFQSFLTARGEGSRNTGSMTLASPFISRASSPVPGPDAGLGHNKGSDGPQPSSPQHAEIFRLRERFFDPNRPTKPLQRKRLSQSHNESLRSVKNMLLENAPVAPKRKGREKYLDYQSPLLSSPRKKSTAPRERRPSAPSGLRRRNGPFSSFKKGKSPEKAVASCPTSPKKFFYDAKDKPVMGPPSFIPSRPGNSRAQVPLSHAHRLPIHESDLYSDLECPEWLRSSMGIGSVDFNRPPSQMSWFGFSHSGEEVDDWLESEDENDSPHRAHSATRLSFSNGDVDGLVGSIFGDDARGVSTPPMKQKGAHPLPLTSLQQSTQPKRAPDFSENFGSVAGGEIDMDLSSIAGESRPTLPGFVLRAPSLGSEASSDESASKYTSQLISLDEAADISWISDSIISPPTIYLERGFKKDTKPSGKGASTREQRMAFAKEAERTAEVQTAADNFRGKATPKDLPMLDLRALQGNSGEKASTAAQSRILLRAQSLPVVIGSTQPKPVLAAATKRTRSGTIVPADHHDPISIPAPPHSTHLEDVAGASTSGPEPSVGRTRSGTVVRCNSGKLANTSAEADRSMHHSDVSAVPLSMTRRTRSGTIQAFVQSIVGEGRSLWKSGGTANHLSSIVPSGDSAHEIGPISGAEAGPEMIYIQEEEEEMEFAPREAAEIIPSERHVPSFLSSAQGDGGCIDGEQAEHQSPFVDDAYVPRDISSPDPIDFLSFCASRVDEHVKLEISAGVEGTWGAKFDGEECKTESVPPLLWSVADPPSPEAVVLPRHGTHFGQGNPSKTPVRRRNHTEKRSMTRKARFQGFEEAIGDTLVAQDSMTHSSGTGFSDDELDLLLKPVDISRLR